MARRLGLCAMCPVDPADAPAVRPLPAGDVGDGGNRLSGGSLAADSPVPRPAADRQPEERHRPRPSAHDGGGLQSQAARVYKLRKKA